MGRMGMGWHTRKAALKHAHGTSRPTSARQPGSPALGRWDSQALAGPCTCSRPAARPALKLAARRRARQPAVDGPPQPLAAAAALERWWAGQPSLQQGRAGGGMGVLSAPAAGWPRARPCPLSPSGSPAMTASSTRQAGEARPRAAQPPERRRAMVACFRLIGALQWIRAN